MDTVAQYQAQLDKELQNVAILKQAEKATGVPKTYIALAGALVLLILVWIQSTAPLVCNLVGFLYPAIASFNAIESASKSDDTQWLAYWVIFGFASLLDTAADLLVYWFPFYYVAKLGFLIYLLLPQTKGAQVVYNRFLRPIILNNFKSGSSASGSGSGSGSKSPSAKDD